MRKAADASTRCHDNSAGVDTSDHEVKHQDSLQRPLRRGELSAEARDGLLTEMTDDVATHVLRDNSRPDADAFRCASRAAKDLDAHGRFMRELESTRRSGPGRRVPSGRRATTRRAQNDKGLRASELAVVLGLRKLD